MSHRCPDELTLAALFDGLLDPQAREALHGEMSGCPDCQDTLALVGLGLADEPAELAPTPPALEARVRALYAAGPTPEPVMRVVVRRIRGALESLADALAPTPLPAMAMRGQEERADLRFEIDVGGTPVELLLAGADLDRTRVTIRPLDPPPPRARVVLARGAEVEASLALGAEGVGLPPLAAGRYALRFEVPGRPDTVLPLELHG